LNGRGFLPEDGPHEDPGPKLRYVAPGSGIYKYVEFSGAVNHTIVMHFPTTDLIDLSGKHLSEEEVREAYKQDTLARFKNNCKHAFQKMVEMQMNGEDISRSIGSLVGSVEQLKYI